jgi:hypothetical protein
LNRAFKPKHGLCAFFFPLNVTHKAGLERMASDFLGQHDAISLYFAALSELGFDADAVSQLVTDYMRLPKSEQLFTFDISVEFENAKRLSIRREILRP